MIAKEEVTTSRVIYFGGDQDDCRLLEQATKDLNLRWHIVPLAGLYGRWAIAPSWLKTRLTLRFANLFSPWVDALRILWGAKTSDLVL
jgi:hypothetical protein